MKALLVIQNNNNYFATLCGNLQKDDLEKFCAYANPKIQGDEIESLNFFKSFVFELGAKESFITREEEINKFFWDEQKRNEIDLILRYDESNQFLFFYMPSSIDSNNLLIEYDVAGDYKTLRSIYLEGAENEPTIDERAFEDRSVGEQRHTTERATGTQGVGAGSARFGDVLRGGIWGSSRETLSERSEGGIEDSQNQTDRVNGTRFESSLQGSANSTLQEETQASELREDSQLFTEGFNTEISQSRTSSAERSSNRSTREDRQSHQQRLAQQQRNLFDFFLGQGEESSERVYRAEQRNERAGIQGNFGFTKATQSANEAFVARIDNVLQSSKLERITRRVLSEFADKINQSYNQQTRAESETSTLPTQPNIAEQPQHSESLLDVSGEIGESQSLSSSGRQDREGERRVGGDFSARNGTRASSFDTASTEAFSASQEYSTAASAISGSDDFELSSIQGDFGDFSHSASKQESVLKNIEQQQSNGDIHKQSSKILQNEQASSGVFQAATNLGDNQPRISNGKNEADDKESELSREADFRGEQEIESRADFQKASNIDRNIGNENTLVGLGGIYNNLEAQENASAEASKKLYQLKVFEKIVFNEENTPYYFVTKFELYFVINNDETDIQVVNFNKPKADFLEMLEKSYPQFIGNEKIYSMPSEVLYPNGIVMLLQIETKYKNERIEILDVNLPKEEYIDIMSNLKGGIPDAPRLREQEKGAESIGQTDTIERSYINKPNNEQTQTESADELKSQKEIALEELAQLYKENEAKYFLDKSNLEKGIIKIREGSIADVIGEYLVNYSLYLPTYNKIQDLNKKIEMLEKQKLQDISAIPIAITPNDNDSANDVSTEIIKEVLEGEIVDSANKGFKTFSEYQFLDKLDGEEYRGEIDFSLSKSQRIKANLEALKVTQEIFSQNRLVATLQEQEVLAKFSGFGGLNELFSDERYEPQRAEFERILGDRLYKEIAYSSFNAYYTPKIIINAMYDGLQAAGVPHNEKIRALEPSCGIGHFITLAPPNYEFEAVEKDTLTATIAKFLHPQTKIHNKGFEDVMFDREFDVVVGNPPYENIHISDDNGNKELIHNYFVLKSQELLKEQGISTFVITSGFLDSKNNTHRVKLAESNFLLDALRLPNTAFNDTHTSVLSDIVFLQKVKDRQGLKERFLSQEIYKDNDYASYNTKRIIDVLENNTTYMKEIVNIEFDKGNVKVNNFFIQMPQNILGDEDIATNQFGENILQVKDDGSFNEVLENLAEKNKFLNGLFSLVPAKESALKTLHNLKLDNKKIKYVQNLRSGNLFEHNGEFYIKEDNFTYSQVYFIDKISHDKKYLLEEDDIIENTIKSKKESKDIEYKNYPNKKEKEILKLLIDFRDLLKENIKNEQELPNDDKNNEFILKQKSRLRELRDKILSLSESSSFNQEGKKRKKNSDGIITMHTLKNMIEFEKLESYRIRACENEIKQVRNGKVIKQYKSADILHKRILYPLIKTEAKNPTEALQKTINDIGAIHLATLQSYLPNVPLPEICKELSEKELIFPNLITRNSYVLKTDFLKGNIKDKYAYITSMLKENKEFDLPFTLPLEQYANILKQNFPQDIHFEDIEIGFGANFVDIDVYENFIKDSFFNNPNAARVRIEKVNFNSAYILENFSVAEIDSNGIERERVVDESRDLNEIGKNLRVFNETDKIKPYFTLQDMLERTINNKNLEVSHKEEIGDNRTRKVVESIPTKEAIDNAENIKDMFLNYIFTNKEYRERIEKRYNASINVFSNKKLEYQNFLEMPMLSKNITLRQHQDNAVFKGILNQSMLYDHQVGAGKTLVAIALTMEQIRMGLIKKALILVPNHLCAQWGNEFLRAYPTAKLLIGDRIDSKKDRKEFLYRSRNGDFDAIIMKHSTFENMSVMKTFETSLLQEELEKIKISLKKDNSNKDRYILARQKHLEAKLEKKAKGKIYDDEIAFEDLGIDCLIVDEAHYFKNLFIETIQHGIKGLSQTDSQKAMKMYCATQYMHQHNYKLYFLTGTPVSNSIAEFYTMQRYLQPQVLKNLNLEHFDDWQKAFTRIVMSEELDSSGVNYTLVSRLSKFVNTPELMSFYKQNADIITNDDIEKISGRIVPKIKNGKAVNIIAPRSDIIANFIGIEDENGNYNEGSIIDRMNHWHDDPNRNNILVCTSEARKAALDFRLINPQAEDYAESKLNKLTQKVLEHYNDKQYEKNTQLIFCDLGVSKIHSQKVDTNSIDRFEFESVEDVASRLGLEYYTQTEKQEDEKGNEFEIEVDSYWVEYKKDNDGSFILDSNKNRIIKKKYSYFDLMQEQSNFDVYSEILKKLVRLGIPQEQIAFIGDAKNDIQKQTLFDKVNAGEVRILIGSTSKMGAGTNVQQRVIALHELDCPWRPADLEQRAGRVIRQGNIFFEMDREHFEIAHYRYATEQTYDARMFQINEQKLLPLIQIKKSELLAEQRVFDSVDSEMANLAEMKAIATGNPFILEKHKIDTLLKQEERHLDYYKKSILGNERALKSLEAKNIELHNEIEALQECFNNKGFMQENYDVEILGIKTSKKPKNKVSEEIFKQTREKIAKELIRLESMPENYLDKGKVELLKANNIALVFQVNFGIHDNLYFKSKIFTPSGKSFSVDNLNFKITRNELTSRKLVLDGILERLKNAFEKIPSILQQHKEALKENEAILQEKQSFLQNNTLESYGRKVLLETLKQDMRNMQEIMKIRNELRKQGVKIDMQSQEITPLLPQYTKLLDDKGKFVGQEQAQAIALHKADSAFQTQENKPQAKQLGQEQIKKHTLANIDMNIERIEQAQIDFREFLQHQSLEDKVAILQNNQSYIAQAPRSRNIANV